MTKSTQYDSSDLTALRRACFDAAQALEAALHALCWGPHRYVQHRDMQPPWCHACRRTKHGAEIPERQARIGERNV